jgi:hypothetical protein
MSSKEILGLFTKAAGMLINTRNYVLCFNEVEDRIKFELLYTFQFQDDDFGEGITVSRKLSMDKDVVHR